MWLLTFFAGTLGRWLAIAGLSVALMAGAYVKGRMDCSSAAEVRQLEATVKQLRTELARREARTRADNAARERDRAELDRLDEINRNLRNELQDPDRVCLNEHDTRQLQDLWP